MAKKPTFLTHVKDWWPLYGIGSTIIGVLVLWASIPGRVAKAEEAVEDLKGWAREVQGYTRAMQQQQMLQFPQPAAGPSAPVGPQPCWNEKRERWETCQE